MKKILYAFLILIINVLIFEILLSFFDSEKVIVKSFDSKYLFSMYPNQTGKVVSEEYTIKVNTNENGFRQKLPIKYDTILLGDSFSEGWGVEENEIYTYKLNNFLAENKKILNLGVHGSSPILFSFQIKQFIEKFKPKKIIVQLFDNDLDDNEKLENFFYFDKDGKVASIKKNLFLKLTGEKIYNIIKESTLYRLFNRVYKFFKKIPSPILYYKENKEPKINTLTHEESLKKYGNLKSLGEEIYTKYNGQFSFYQEPNSDKWKLRLKKNKIYMQDIIKTAKENKIQIEFIYIPAKEFFAKNGINGKLKTNALEEYNINNPFYLQIKELCDKEKLNCIYLNNLFFNSNPEDLYFPYDAHLNKKGHDLFADKLIKIYTQQQ